MEDVVLHHILLLHSLLLLARPCRRVGRLGGWGSQPLQARTRPRTSFEIFEMAAGEPALSWAPAFAGSPCSDGACPPRRGGEPRGCGVQNRMQQQQQQQAPAPRHAASQYSSMQYGQHLQKQYGGSQYGQQHAYQHTLRSTLPEVCFAGRTYACCVHAAAHRREAGHGPGGGSVRRTTCLARGTTRGLQRGERETDYRVFCRALLCRAMPASARAGKPQPRQPARKLAGQPASAEYAQHASVYSSTDPEAAAHRGREQAHKRVLASLSRQIQVAQQKVDARRSALEGQMGIVEESSAVLQHQRASLARVTAELEKLKAVETEDNRKDIVLLESLVSLNQRRELQEEAFRAHCVDQVCR
jgi:hypothetical protein